MKFKRIVPFLAIAFLALLLVSLWVGWAWFVTDKFPVTQEVGDATLQAAALRAYYGEMFGGINALFTALLLAGAIYTIWIQQKQIESIRAQQIASERDGNRFATLMAMTALVNAKGTLLSTRYTMVTDLGKSLSSETLSKEWRPIVEVMAYTNAETAGKDFKDLDRLAAELEGLIENISAST